MLISSVAGIDGLSTLSLLGHLCLLYPSLLYTVVSIQAIAHDQLKTPSIVVRKN